MRKNNGENNEGGKKKKTLMTTDKHKRGNEKNHSEAHGLKTFQLVSINVKAICVCLCVFPALSADKCSCSPVNSG